MILLHWLLWLQKLRRRLNNLLQFCTEARTKQCKEATALKCLEWASYFGLCMDCWQGYIVNFYDGEAGE